jgi:hypothetical protein
MWQLPLLLAFLAAALAASAAAPAAASNAPTEGAADANAAADASADPASLAYAEDLLDELDESSFDYDFTLVERPAVVPAAILRVEHESNALARSSALPSSARECAWAARPAARPLPLRIAFAAAM